MPANPKQIFISYAHEDEEWKDLFVKFLNVEPETSLVWHDGKINWGDDWNKEIEKALDDASAAVLLLSVDFLNSEFIKSDELPKLLASRESAGLKVFPLLVRPCSPGERLKNLQVRPKGLKALSDMPKAKREAELTKLAGEIAAILESEPSPGGRETQSRSGEDAARANAVKLLADSLLGEHDQKEGQELAAKLERRVRELTGLSGDGLFKAVRFFIESQLLYSDDPGSPKELENSLADPDGANAGASNVAVQLQQRSKGVDFSFPALVVKSRFFLLAGERQDLWKRYFDAVAHLKIDGLTTQSVASLSRIRISQGFLAPQFLVAGLLARFQDDWQPVLNAYQRAISRDRPGAFESLQASQWNCWLVWGPSIPICECEQWDGVVAYQYGYGDENNSLPVLDLAPKAAKRADAVATLLGDLNAENRHARLARLTGRLRWGPWIAGERKAVVDETDDIADPLLLDQAAQLEQPWKAWAAPAQSSLYKADVHSHRDDRDGLILELEEGDDNRRNKQFAETRLYFSAYLWLMFLVAVPGADPAVGPKLLREKIYPEWAGPDHHRGAVREARLWDDLLPIFVHANIADPAALGIQKRILSGNALQMLRQVWERRSEMFHPKDVESGIRFYLVCGSDYTGCGCPVRHPSGESLVQLLRDRLGTEADKAFTGSVVLPAADETPQDRPQALAGFFSSCHFPEMIADYYEYVYLLNQAAGG